MNKYKQRQRASSLLAYATLKHWQPDFNDTELRNEKSRLDRILAEEYTTSKLEMEFNEFCLEWMRQNSKEFIYGNAWNYDIIIPDNRHEINVNNFAKKRY